MILQNLHIERFRNLCKASLSLSPRFNLIHGDNGAGKTSVLEAIHVLSQLRSFTTRNLSQLIQHGEQDFVLRAALVEETDEASRAGSLALRRHGDATELKVDGNGSARPSDAADRLPVLAIHPGSFSLLVGPRSERRSFLDWGVFYRQPSLRPHWRQYRQALRQRNSAIRGGMTRQAISCWDPVLATAGEAIAEARSQYLDALVSVVDELAAGYRDSPQLALRFSRGWPRDLSLGDALRESLDSDRARGFTYPGAHRGGFSVLFNGHPISASASRGQLKLATILLKLAQLQLLRGSGRQCVLLLDDIDAEIDAATLAFVLEVIDRLSVQTLVTTLHLDRFGGWAGGEVSMFHVEQGKIAEVDK